MKPEDANGRGYAFAIGKNQFFAGLFDFDPVKFPGIVTPKLLIKNGTTWELVKAYDTIWKDVQEDIFPNPDDLAVSIVNNFNKELEKYQEGGELSYVDKLALIFQMRLALVGGKLTIKPE